ncbi:MAG TPA: hypothetical protein VJ851_18565 [Jatrophihabitans sp.]|nr:hypothetical protein [Jatrophihabitans sp.]
MNSTENDLDQLISGALHARANQLTAADLTPAAPPLGSPSRRPSWAVPLLAAAAVAAIAVGSTVVIRSVTASSSHPGSGGGIPTGGVPISHSAVPSTTSSGRPTGAPSSAGPTVKASPGNTTVTASSGPAGFTLGYQPLWPFTDYAQATSWLAANHAQGSQPWHLDAAQTALAFTRSYLKFTEITMVTSSRTDGQGAHVGVGYRNPAGALATAAVLHLVRYGTAADSGWEVVGSDDTTFSLEQPAYGSTVSSPVVAGGHITGVDEAILLAVRNQAGTVVSSSAPSIPAGGSNQPWHGTVTFNGTGVLTIVASTGGHLQAVERFAIQGVRA